jgi:cell wall-associated NlpC family hydrolase
MVAVPVAPVLLTPYHSSVSPMVVFSPTAPEVQVSPPLRVVRDPDVNLALAGYNVGSAAVIAAGGIPQNGQTAAYVMVILADEATYTLKLTQAPGGTSLGLEIVKDGETQLGVPYAYGGGTDTGPSTGIGTVGFKCSGLVMFAVFEASHGTIQLPHLSEADGRDSNATRTFSAC